MTDWYTYINNSSEMIQPKKNQLRKYNWLVRRIRTETLAEKIKKYASGTLVDIGCGEKPYTALTQDVVTRHIGVDHPDTRHNQRNINIFASAYNTTLPNASADTVLCTAVLEHLEQPKEAIQEMYRILKCGGYVILTAPFFWHLHEEPRDFYRYSKYGLEYLFTKAGFQIVEITPLSGFVVTFAQELCYFLERFRYRRYLTWPISVMQFLIQWVAYRLHRWDKSYGFTWLYLVVAQKRN